MGDVQVTNLKDMLRSKLGLGNVRVPLVNRRYKKGVPMVYERVRG